MAPKGTLVLVEARLAEHAQSAAVALSRNGLGIAHAGILGGRGSRPLRHLVERQPMGAWRALTGIVATQGHAGELSLAGACRAAAQAWDESFSTFAEERSEWTDRNLARAWAAQAVPVVLR